MFGFVSARSSASFQDAVCKPDELAQRAHELGHTHLGLCDSGNVMAAVPLQKACDKHGLKPVFGASLRVLLEPLSPEQLEALPSGPSDEIWIKPSFWATLTDKLLSEGALHQGLDDPRKHAKTWWASQSPETQTQLLREHQATIQRPGFQVRLLVEDAQGWANLCTLLSIATRQICYGPTVTLVQLLEAQEGLVVLVGGLDHPNDEEFQTLAATLEPNRLVLGLEDCALLGEGGACDWARRQATTHGYPLVFSNQARYSHDRQAPFLRALHSASTGLPMSHPLVARWSTDQQGLKDRDEVDRLFEEPSLLANTADLLARLDHRLQLGTPYLPLTEPPREITHPRSRWAWMFKNFPPPAEWDLQLQPPPPRNLDQVPISEAYFRWYVEEGLRRRLVDVPPEKHATYWSQVRDDEYPVILTSAGGFGFASYFLIVSEFINWAKDHDIPVGAGRGSAAGSIAAWAMRITDLDPIAYELVFERFLNPGRLGGGGLPDIDVDISQEGREHVIEHIREKYGRDKVGQIATLMAYSLKVALTDVGRALGLHFGDVKQLTKGPLAEIGSHTEAMEIDTIQRMQHDPRWRHAFALAGGIASAYRGTSVHAGGVIITDRPIATLAPLMELPDGRTVVGMDMNDAESVGLVKFDVLGLINLDILHQVELEVERLTGQRYRYGNIPLDDEATLELLSQGRGLGVFQVESEGMRQLLTRIKPNALADLIALVALYRPGPLMTGMVDDFIERKHGRAATAYPLPELKPILEDTYGVWVYQEQIQRAAQVLAGYTLGEADSLRRAVAKKKAKEMAPHKARFIEGGVERGHPREVMEKIWTDFEGFASYSFNLAHSACYGLISYLTAWFKAHHPAAFMAAVMTWAQKGKKNWAARLQACTAEARSSGLTVLAPHVNRSEIPFVVEDGSIRWGLGQIKGLGDSSARFVVAERKRSGAFTEVRDFGHRVPKGELNKTGLNALVSSGGLDGLGCSRDQVAAIARDGHSPLQGALFSVQEVSRVGECWSWDERLRREIEAIGVPLSGSPLDRYLGLEERLRERSIPELPELRPNTDVTLVGSIQSVYKDRTRSGDAMADLHLVDRKGVTRVSVFPTLWPSVKERVEVGTCVIVRGYRPQGGGFVAREVRPLSEIFETTTSELRLCLDRAELEDRRKLEAVRSCLERHSAESGRLASVCLQTTTHNARVTLSLPHRVVPTQELLSELEGIFDRTGFVYPVAANDGIVPVIYDE